MRSNPGTRPVWKGGHWTLGGGQERGLLALGLGDVVMLPWGLTIWTHILPAIDASPLGRSSQPWKLGHGPHVHTCKALSRLRPPCSPEPGMLRPQPECPPCQPLSPLSWPWTDLSLHNGRNGFNRHHQGAEPSVPTMPGPRVALKSKMCLLP